MESPEFVLPLATPKIARDRNREFFFKCPVGGFASLSPGICPKCNAQLVAVSAGELSTGEHPVGDGNHSVRVRSDETG